MVRMTGVRAAAVLTAVALGLAACGGGGEADSGAAASTAAAPTGPVVTPDLVGMQIEGAEVEAWSSAPLGALRLWDNGTAWSQIELAKGEYKWDNLDGIIANAKSKGMNDILMVLVPPRSGPSARRRSRRARTTTRSPGRRARPRI